MNKWKKLIPILLVTLLISCSNGVPEAETTSEALSDAQLAAIRESELAEQAARESEALERAKEEDRLMAEADFEENRYTTFMGVDYELTFMDSFNGHALDETKWAYCPNWTRDQCVWTEDAAYLEDGNLILAVTGSEIPYSAGAIRTRDIFQQQYGYWEIRCKLPEAEGICGAFWLMCGGRRLGWGP